MTERKLLTLDDFVKQPTTYTRFGEKVTRNPIEQIYDAGLLKDYKQLSVSSKYLKFTGMQEENDGGEGWYIRDESITDEEDIGVIIYIGQYKYRRLYGAYVLVDWFYTGDFGIALQRACKYASVRCVPGKVYECNSEITLKLNVRGYSTSHGIGHGHLDYGHVIVDLRGATINYNVEGSSYCFNIRIYNRETKFMLTNGTFNVSEESKVYLKNIANVIGGNNYTDMLTDMHYNVDKELLPDTNRVVLFSEPVVEGVKTFSKSLNYVGDSISAADNQAVTKDYITPGINESRYIAINDSRKLDGITKFKQIYDTLGGNIAYMNIDYTTLLAIDFFNIISNNIIPIYPNFSSYVSVNTPIIAGSWSKYSEVSGDNYIVSANASNIKVAAQPQCIIDENDIGVPVYLKLDFSSNITVDNPEIIEEDNVVLEDYVDLSYYSDTDDAGILQLSNFTFVEVTSPLSEILGYKVDNNKIYVACNVVSITTERYTRMIQNTLNLIAFYSDGVAYCFNTSMDSAGHNLYITPHYSVFESQCVREIFTKFRAFTVSAYISGSYYKLSFGEYFTTKSISDAILLEHKTKLKIDTGKIYRLANVNMQLASSYVTGSEYISLESPSFYLGDYTINNNNSISFSTLFIKLVTPVQANLEERNYPEQIKPCSILYMSLLYNKMLITVNPIEFYIARFIPRGQPAYEVPLNISKGYTTTTKYPLYKLYTNNWINPIKYDLMLVDATLDPGVYIDTYIYRSQHCDDKKGTCKCPCIDRAGTITDNPEGYIFTKYTMYGNTFTKAFTERYNTYMNGCGTKNCGCTKFATFITGSKCGYLMSEPNLEKNCGYYLNTVEPNFIITTGNIIYKDSIPELKHGEVYYAKQYFDSHQNKAKYTETKVNCRVRLAGESPACGTDGSLDQLWNLYRSTRYYNAVFGGAFKSKLFARVFGPTVATKGKLIRDGVLTDPVRDRHNAIEHATSMPVSPY